MKGFYSPAQRVAVNKHGMSHCEDIPLTTIDERRKDKVLESLPSLNSSSDIFAEQSPVLLEPGDFHFRCF